MPAHTRVHTDVAVVGAGVVGASIALELARRGREVTVLDTGAGWGTGCSHGNAGLVCPSHAGPYATRADLGNAVRWLLSPGSPMGVAPRPGLVPFLTELLAATRPSVTSRALDLSRRMCARSLQIHEELQRSGLDTGLRRKGLVDTYATEAGLARAHDAAERHRERGLRPEVLDAAEVRRRVPGLDETVVGGVLFPDEAHCDPAHFVRTVAAAAERAGVRLLPHAEVLAVDTTGPGVSMETTAGTVTATTVVLATGARPPGALPGVRAGWMPLAGGKGYSVDLAADGRSLPEQPFMLQEARVAVTPLGDRLRLAGTMQFTTPGDTGIARRRVAGIRGPAARLLPGWRDATVVSVWAGLRPLTPDGLPYLGWLDRDRRVAVCAGHAMLGLTLAPLSGVQVADLVEDKPVEFAEHLAPHRFGGRARSRRALR
ncbi:NAD(P)/FAD-dependent oxidoreductase [Pseudonocardia alni]|uniref:NAD(P)/FAD-dependent oxidoreductase n=1 Tax=Pseudonocardia alni TaxID=33907 RepID=UPI003320C4B1